MSALKDALNIETDVLQRHVYETVLNSTPIQVIDWIVNLIEETREDSLDIKVSSVEALYQEAQKLNANDLIKLHGKIKFDLDRVQEQLVKNG